MIGSGMRTRPINADMSDMLTRIRAQIPNYAAVHALPTFTLFPWFFVIPGVLVAGCAALALRGRPSPNQPSGG